MSETPEEIMRILEESKPLTEETAKETTPKLQSDLEAMVKNVSNLVNELNKLLLGDELTKAIEQAFEEEAGESSASKIQKILDTVKQAMQNRVSTSQTATVTSSSARTVEVRYKYEKPLPPERLVAEDIRYNTYAVINNSLIVMNTLLQTALEVTDTYERYTLSRAVLSLAQSIERLIPIIIEYKPPAQGGGKE